MKFLAITTLSLALLAGCHGTSETPPYDGGDIATVTGTMSTTTTGPATIPFAVDTYYAASGYMGDGVTMGALVDDTSCASRAGDKLGLCHHLTYTPATLQWSGIYWQYPEGNWGTAGSPAGHEIAAGATRISFWAWGAKGGETVDFFSGINPPDGYKLDNGPVVLTKSPTQYFLQFGSTPYGKEVVGAFGWSTAAAGSAPTEFFVDDIQWKN